ncbi:MAG: thioredoxin family protein [Hyphomicrobiaceae bacterium]|nr:thioredoxin family protein [Hyphomicrobiaceae bacterium]
MCCLAGIALADPKAPEGAEQWNSAEIAWRTPADGLAEAKREGKVALVVVHTTWCPVCQSYRKMFKNRRVVDASRKVAMILVDADLDPEGDRAFGHEAGSVPRTLVVDENKTVMIKDADPEYLYYVDPEDPDELLKLMKEAAALTRAPGN